MQALWTGLIIAGASGVTTLAFKHPHAFARLFPYLIVSITTIYIGLTVWDVAVHLTWIAINPFVDQDRFELAKLAMAGLRLPYQWIGGTFVAVLALLWVDLKLPLFIKNSEASRHGRAAKRVKD